MNQNETSSPEKSDTKLELELEVLKIQIKTLEIRMAETEKVVLTISQTVRQIAGLQQQIATQISHLSESIRDIQDALDPTSVLKYDMLNEPYN